MIEKSSITIADIARETGIAESTIRFYRDKFAHYLPSIGEGRKRRYEPQAIKIFKEIAELSNKGTLNSEIELFLSKQYAHNPIILEQENIAVTARTTAEPQFTETAVKAETAITARTTAEPQYILPLLEVISKIIQSPQKEPEKIYCTSKEAALRTGLSQEFIKKSCREYLKTKTGIPCIKTGRGYVIHKSMLDDWFAEMINPRGVWRCEHEKQ